jgi:hypothetical protein
VSGGFVKLYGTLLLGSSLMDEALEARWLFVCFLAEADETGFVRCQTVGNAARLANLTHDQASKALEVLSSPDPKSTSPDDEGRRIVPAPGGWRVVNYAKYREMRTQRQLRKTERQRRWRDRQASTVDAVDAVRSEVSASASHSVSVSVEGVQGEGRPSASQPFYRPPGPANPLVAGRRPDLERECLALVRELAAMTGEDPVEVLAHAASYEGARRTKLNPATMSDDRLAATVRDLRADVTAERAKGVTSGAAKP